LREATNRYSQGGGEGEPAPDIEEEARPLFFQCLDEIRKLLPKAQAAQAPKWRGLSRIDLEDLYAFVYGFLAEEDVRRDEYLQAELRLTSAFLLVKHLDDCRVHADEIRTAVRRVLRRRNVKSEDFEPFIEKFMAQAEALYATWPLAA